MSRPAALVTGASSGLGRAVALELAGTGRPMVLLGRDPERLGSVAAEVEARGGSAVIARADVRERRALAEAVGEGLGERPLDTVVHAAGILELAPLEHQDEALVRRLLEVNVVGTTNVVAATLPRLERSRGRLAVVASIVAILPVPGGFSAYAASKWALRGWGETARHELARRGVSLTMAYPSTIDTPMVRGTGGREQVPVYRAFAWHPPDRVARRLVRDVERRRAVSWACPTDRLAALAVRLLPGTFPRLFHAVVRWRGREKRQAP